MIVQEIIKIITIMVASSFKMLFGVPLAIATGYNQLESIIIASAGGIIGVVIFTFFSQWIINVIEKFGSKKEKRIFIIILCMTRNISISVNQLTLD